MSSTRKQFNAPWHSFLKELELEAGDAVELVCIGGFVVTQLYDGTRSTGDIDFIEFAANSRNPDVLELGQLGGTLHRSHGVYLDPVTVAVYPDNYKSRLVEMYPGVYGKLRLLALDPYDLALTKLERNSQKDRDDVRFLARTTPLDLNLLRSRYLVEMRWQLGVPEREDLTLELWMEMIGEDRANAPR